MLLKSLLLLLFLSFATSRDTIRSNQDQLKDDGGVLESKESNFELGFFSPGHSSYRYVGIWYSESKVTEKTVVWVANRNNPINDTSGVLKINRYGELALYAYNLENDPIWSTNVSLSVQNTSTLSAQLLNTGNIVVYQDDKDEIFIRQSFDHPTDTLIPGMKLGLNWKIGLEWFLTSWKSQEDPGTGDYTFRLYPNQNASTPQYFVHNGVTKYWRAPPCPWQNFVSNPDEMYYSRTYNTDVTKRITLQASGLYQDLKWDGADHKWKEVWSVPKYRCDWYGQCGANSKCFPDNVNLFECECLPGYEPKSVDSWNQKDGSGGCVNKRVGVPKCRNGEGFVKVTRVKAL